MAAGTLSVWRRMTQSASLKRKMIGMLIAMIIQSVLATALVIWFGSIYFQSSNATMEDCYHINRLLSAYTAEIDAFDTYMLYRDTASEQAWLEKQPETDNALSQTHIPYRQSKDQYALLAAARTTLASFRSSCTDTLALVSRNLDYAAAYAQTIRVGEYLKAYFQTLLHSAISNGQAVYQRDMALISRIPLLFMISVILVILGMAVWTRWVLRHVVAPINDLTRATRELSKNQYDLPDIKVYQEDELAQLARMFNKMKHATHDLVDSLRDRSEMEARLREEAVQRMKTEAAMDSLRLSLLQSQINPHFLFNTLNIISRMAQIEQAPKSEELIKRLSNLFRYNLQSVEDVVALSAELKIVNDYMAIQEIRFGERIRFEIDVRVDTEKMKLPVFTLQPLIENAVIHGVGPLEEGGDVRVLIKEENERLVIAVSDTGRGIAPGRLKELMDSAFNPGRHVSGLGVGNVRARIAAYREGSTFEIQSLPGSGTTILIQIPLIEEEMAYV